MISNYKPKLKSDSYINAEWPVPARVRACATTRIGGNSLSPFDSFNLGKHVGDEEQNVIHNRQKLVQDLGLKQTPIWLEQTHSTKILNVDRLEDRFSSDISNPIIEADASFSAQPGRVCVVMTADCLPILLANKTGTWIAAVHAGWRGLADGIVQKTVAAYPGDARELVAWLGPAISQSHFEIREDVKSIFQQKDDAYSAAFKSTAKGKYHGDLYAIARMILNNYEVDVFGGKACTFSQSSQFYSYRRDGKTGRMASLIWIDDDLHRP